MCIQELCECMWYGMICWSTLRLLRTRRRSATMMGVSHRVRSNHSSFHVISRDSWVNVTVNVWIFNGHRVSCSMQIMQPSWSKNLESLNTLWQDWQIPVIPRDRNLGKQVAEFFNRSSLTNWQTCASAMNAIINHFHRFSNVQVLIKWFGIYSNAYNLSATTHIRSEGGGSSNEGSGVDLWICEPLPKGFT